MLPKTHAIIGAIASVLVYFIFNISIFEALLFFFASVFIDFDHYLWHIIKEKDFSLKHAYYSFKKKGKSFDKFLKNKKKTFKMPYFIFHALEFWIILVILAYFNKLFIFILGGIAVHMISDYVEIIHGKNLIYPKVSIILTVLINRNKKKHYF